MALMLVAPLTMLVASATPACVQSEEPTDTAPTPAGEGEADASAPGQRATGPDAQPDAQPTAPSPVVFGDAKPPPDFMVNGKAAIFVEITGSRATLDIDVAAKTATVKSRMDITVHQAKGGSPLLDVVPTTAQFVTVDNAEKVALATVTSPDGQSTMRMVDATLSAGKHTLDFTEYALKQGKSTYNQTFVEGIDFTTSFEFLTDDDDLRSRYFAERYFPSGFEFNRYPFTVTVNVRNATAAQKPDVMANGTITATPDGKSFEVAYPANDSTSAWFMHVIDRSVYVVATGEYTSIDGRKIPISAHALKQAEADQAIADAKIFFAELEGDYGPYPKERLLISVGGVNDPEEYDGACQTDMDLTEKTPVDRGALGHEMLHQWFGRSARPMSGRDGWVDEGIAEWRDGGYRRASAIKLDGAYVSLAVASPYQRGTPEASYDQGSAVNQGLDLLLADRGGLKPVLKAFHAKFKDKLYTTEDYLDFIRSSAPDLKSKMDPIFAKKVYAGAPVP